jgi:Mce-associated membrane protein
VASRSDGGLMSSAHDEKTSGRRTLATDASPAVVTEEADIAEAEAAEAEALAVAARARARAARLRGEAVEAQPEPPIRAARSGLRARLLRRPRWTTVALAASTVLIGASAAVAGAVWWQHRQVVQEQQHSAEFAAAARQGVVTLMSLNYNTAKHDVQRLIDDTTEDFRKDLESSRDDFITVVEGSKVATSCTVEATAVQSMSPDSAVVLVSATSDVTNSAGAKHDPRTWRLGVTVTRDGGQLKMSKVEFVP